MTPETTIRPAVATDVDTLLALCRRTILACYPPVIGEKPVRLYLESGAIETYFEESLKRCFVIEEAEVILGVGSYKDNVIELMMIDADLRRRGLGGRLLAHLENVLFEKFAALTIESFARNNQANAFYRKHDWRTLEEFVDKRYGIPMLRLGKARDCSP